MELSVKAPIVRQTLYEQVYQILALRIADGTLPQNSYLPNEFELSREFSVSIGTIRKAVDMLVHENLLLRQQGRGTVVRDGRWLSVRNKANKLRHGFEGAVLHWRYQEIEYRQVQAPDEIARWLKIRQGELVHQVLRTRKDDFGSIVVEDNFSPVSRLPSLAVDESGRRSAVLQHLADGGVLGRVDEGCIAVAASSRAAGLLNIETGAPLLKMIRIIHDKHDNPLEYRVAYMHSIECFYWSSID